MFNVIAFTFFFENKSLMFLTTFITCNYAFTLSCIPTFLGH